MDINKKEKKKRENGIIIRERFGRRKRGRIHICIWYM